MESGIQNEQRALQTDCYVLWHVQLPSNIPIYDGQHLYYHDQRKTGDCLHGQHPHIFWDKRRTYMDHKNGTGETKGKQFIPQGQEMQILQDEN